MRDPTTPHPHQHVMFSVFQILAILIKFAATNSVLELAHINLLGWVVKFLNTERNQQSAMWKRNHQEHTMLAL